MTGSFGPAGSLAEGHWGLREVRGAHTATLLSDGRVLVVGGVSTKDGEADYLATAEV